MRWRHGSTAAAAVLIALVLAGCSNSRAPYIGPRFVTPPLVYLTTALWAPPLSLVGLVPGSRIELQASVVSRNSRWTSDATYTVPATGVIDLDATRPQFAPFASPDSAALVWSLQGPELSPQAAERLWTKSVVDVHVRALDAGRIIASTVLHLRGLGDTVTPRTVRSSDLRGAGGSSAPDPPAGMFYAAQPGERPPSPAVIVFDDDVTGASSAYVAPLMTLFGAAVFVVPVERAADRVHFTSTFGTAEISAILDWLSARRDVDAQRIFVYGTSQSEQLALWVAGEFPDRIYGAFAAGGTTAPLCRSETNTPDVYDAHGRVLCDVRSDAVDVFSVTKLGALPGPVVLACATNDEVLPDACAWQDALARIRGMHVGDVILRAEGASHAITVPPGLPLSLPAGAAAQATERARVDFWNAVARILLRSARS